jgi:IclR family transcriptional regulator, pca regulon regulatory protein
MVSRARKPAAVGQAPAPPGPESAAEEIRALGGDPDFMTSLARGLAVLRAFSQQRPYQSISHLSLRTGIPRAAVRRCLHTLARLGYVGHDADRRAFALRPKVLTLGFAFLSSSPVASLAQPLLDSVSEQLRESSSLAVLDNDEVVYVARSKTARRIMSVDLGIGSRLPAYCTSLGRVLLAGLAPADLQAYLSRVKLVRHTQHTIVSREKLRVILDQVRRRGFAIVDQELEMGLRSIAVPVADAHGQVRAAINAGTQAFLTPVDKLESRFLPVLRDAAADLMHVPAN